MTETACEHCWHRESVVVVNPKYIVQRVIETFRCSRCLALRTEKRDHDTATRGRVR